MEESEPQTQIQINEWKLAGCLFKDFFLLERAWLQKLKKKVQHKKVYSLFQVFAQRKQVTVSHKWQQCG